MVLDQKSTETRLPNKLWCSEQLNSGDSFPVSPKPAATWLVATTTRDTCRPMRREKYSWVSSTKIISISKSNTNIKCQVVRCHGNYLFGFQFVTSPSSAFLFQPCYGSMLILPSTDKTNVVHPLPPLEREIHLIWISSLAICFTLRRTPGYWYHSLVTDNTFSQVFVQPAETCGG